MITSLAHRVWLTAAMVLVCGSTHAASSIGVQFSGAGSAYMHTILTPGQSAGVLPQTNWNVIKTIGGEADPEIVNGTSGELRDAEGNLTAVKLQYAGGDDSWRLSNSASLTNAGNANLKLMSGEIKTHESMTFRWSGLRAGSYQVYLYGAVDGGEATLSVTVGGNTYYWTEPSSNAGPFTEAARSSDPGAPGRGNYMHLTGLSPDSSGHLEITVTYISGNGAEMAAGITGLQLVTEGTFPAGLTTPPSYTAILGVQFSGANRGGAAVLAPGEKAGYVLQPNWNVITTANGEVSQGTALFLQDNATNHTRVALVYDGNDSWGTLAGRFSADDRLMKGYLGQDTGGNGFMTLTFTNLGAGPYDLYLYGNVLDGPSTLSVELGGRVYYWTEPPAFNGFYQPAALSTDASAPGSGNFLRINNVVPVQGTIPIRITYLDGSIAGIAALQLGSSTPFPAVPLTIRPEPTSQVALAGTTATFTSGAIGLPPISYQWQKNPGNGWMNVVNDARISGATTGTLTIGQAGAADAISYRLVASNQDGALHSVTSSVVSLSLVSEAIGVDFSGDDANVGNVTARILPPSAVAGVLAQANWNWVDNRGGGGGLGVTGISVPLSNHLGIATRVRLVFEGNDAWFCSAGETADNNGKMMKGVLKQEGVDPGVTLTFTNLLAGSYDLFLYGNNSDGPVVMSVSAGASTYYWDLAQNFLGTFIQTPLRTNPDTPGAGNYMHLTGLAPEADGTITVTCAWVSGTSYIGIAGVQIIKSTGSFSPSPVAINADPMPSVLYAGRDAVFTVGAASGYLPLAYQWQVNTGSGWANLVNDAKISGATADTLSIAKVSAADTFSYRVIVTDAAAHSATSGVASLTIAPPPAANSYAAAVLASQPLAYYRLNEAAGITNVFDFVGGHHGYYQVNAMAGLPGVPNPPYVGFEAENLSFQSSAASQVNSYALAPFGTLAGMSHVTFTLWIHPYGPQSPGSAGLIVDRTGAGGGGGLMYDGSGVNLACQWNTNTASEDIITATFDSGLAIPEGMWSFCALSVSPAGASLYLYNENGLASTNHPTPLAPQTFGNGWHIGQDMNDANPFKAFDGLIDEVAIFGSALSTDQITRLYLAAQKGYSAPPRLALVRSGQNLVLTWQQGILLQAPAVTGPWTMNSAATSPYTVPVNQPTQFYRLQIPVVP